jgi:spore maturation protein CgeB
MQYEVWIETLNLIRDSGVLLLNWSTDDSWKYYKFSRLIAHQFDLFVTTHPSMIHKYHADGITTAVVSQWAANSETLAPPIESNRCLYDVSFIGSAYGNRRSMIHRLQQEGVHVRCFGHGWPSGSVDAKRIPEIIRNSRVSLNFSEGSQGTWNGFSTRQIKARVFEVPGYGGCLLTQQAPHLEQYFCVGQEVLAFEGQHEMVTQVRLLLMDSERRDRIARQGFERVRDQHTYDRRFAELFREFPRHSAYRRRSSIDWSVFENATRRHRLGSVLRMLRAGLVFIASTLWGARRGPRAARRLTFEISWRLRGAWTYTAAGWPGRLFYRES